MAIRRMRLNRGKEGDTGVTLPSAPPEGQNSGEGELCPFNDDIIDEICQMAGWPNIARGLEYEVDDGVRDDLADDIREYTKRAIKLAISTKNMRDALNCQLSDPNAPLPAPVRSENNWYVEYMGGIGNITTSQGAGVMRGLGRATADEIVAKHNAAIRAEREEVVAIYESEDAPPADTNLIPRSPNVSVGQIDVEVRPAQTRQVTHMSGRMELIITEDPSVLITILGQGNPHAMLREAQERFFERDLTTIRNI